MDGGWLISYVALWMLTLVLAITVLAHSRLLGLLHQRVGPSGARPLADGPAIGSTVDRLYGRHLDGTGWAWPFPAATDVILLFVSPQCHTCNELMPHVKDFVRTTRDHPLILLSTIDDAGMNRAYVAYQRLEKLSYVASAALAEAFDIAGTPYAVRVDARGVVLAKGVVNTFEHLRSLVAAVPAGGRVERVEPDPMIDRRGEAPNEA